MGPHRVGRRLQRGRGAAVAGGPRERGAGLGRRWLHPDPGQRLRARRRQDRRAARSATARCPTGRRRSRRHRARSRAPSATPRPCSTCWPGSSGPTTVPPRAGGSSWRLPASRAAADRPLRHARDRRRRRRPGVPRGLRAGQRLLESARPRRRGRAAAVRARRGARLRGHVGRPRGVAVPVAAPDEAAAAAADPLAAERARAVSGTELAAAVAPCVGLHARGGRGDGGLRRHAHADAGAAARPRRRASATTPTRPRTSRRRSGSRPSRSPYNVTGQPALSLPAALDRVRAAAGRRPARRSPCRRGDAVSARGPARAARPMGGPAAACVVMNA